MVHRPSLIARAAAKGLKCTLEARFDCFLDGERRRRGPAFLDLATSVGVRPKHANDDVLSDDQFARRRCTPRRGVRARSPGRWRRRAGGPVSRTPGWRRRARGRWMRGCGRGGPRAVAVRLRFRVLREASCGHGLEQRQLLARRGAGMPSVVDASAH